MSFNGMASLLVHHPYMILIAFTVFSGTCLLIPLIYKSFPNFSDPQMGFETRGTDLSNKVIAWKNLMESTRESGPFTVNPKEYLNRLNNSHYFKPKKKKNSNKVQTNQEIGKQHIFVTDESNYTRKKTQNTWKKLQILMNNDNPDSISLFPNDDDYFCGAPTDGYAQLVYKSDIGKDLFNADSLFNLCRLEMELVQANHFKELCIMTAQKPRKCCKPWSISNYVALLNKRTSCLAITEDDVDGTKSLLVLCAKYYNNMQLLPDCYEQGNCKAPKECIKHNAIYNMLHFLASTTFLPPNKREERMQLKETIIFLPVACSIATLPYYYDLQTIQLKYKDISVVAMEFGIKSALFDQCLLQDMWLMAVGALFVLFCMWIYTDSWFLTLMTIIAIVFSLSISYFVYTCIFNFRFFPFMNLLAGIVAIGIGADDAFIFCKAWSNVKKSEDNLATLQIMNQTMQHALISMFVTSLTTAAAFLASYFSSITAIRCFGMFAGIAVISNYVLMITWLPACLVLLDKNDCCVWYYAGLAKTRCMFYLERQCRSSCVQQWRLAITNWNKFVEKFRNAIETLIINAVIKLKFICLMSLSIIAIISAIIVFYNPKLQLPNSNEFQLFNGDHPFEKYDMVYKYKFWFKRMQKNDDSENSLIYKLPLRFVWGVLPTDNGNHMDPHSLGELEMDAAFAMSEPESQQWLLEFCTNLRKQRFYAASGGPLLTNCFIETFAGWMQRRCTDPVRNRDRSPCCQTSRFPYNTTVFDVCIIDAVSDLYETPSEYFVPGEAGPKFSKDPSMPTIEAIVIEYDSNYTYSMSYEYMKLFIEEVNDWMRVQLLTAPANMKRGWFITEVEFFDLQRALSENTFEAVIISMALSFIVLFASTLNVITSVCAIFTITCSIVTTMALLVLSGWKLNILEAVAVSSTIGLTIDFSLHYTVNYKMCPAQGVKMEVDREVATRYTLATIIGPATMATLTTGAVGAIMMPSQILAYKQIGQFLVTVMSVSWIYGTFHLGALLAIAGPRRHFGFYYYCRLLRRCFVRTNSRGVERPNEPATNSIHTLADINRNDDDDDDNNHELDSLATTRTNSDFTGVKADKGGGVFSTHSPSEMSVVTIMMHVDDD